MLSRSLRAPALRGAVAALHPSSTASTLLPRSSQSLIQTRLLSQEVRTAIDQAVASAPVVLFMKGTPETPQCGFSRTSIQILSLQGLDPRNFTAFNVLEDEDLRSGIKEYSDWPTIPQLYVNKDFVGGCDILMQMHKDGSLAELLSKNKLIVEESGDIEGEKAEAVRETTEQSTGARSKDAKGESS
ncbi:monothiol glutaredoxin grx5 [Lithohypha guttulata]|nr:monothiol glutaredoxin grx5 [Lithohypha guttulata]